MSQTADCVACADQSCSVIGRLPSPEREKQKRDRNLAPDWPSVFTPETYYGERGLDWRKGEIGRNHLQTLILTFFETLLSAYLTVECATKHICYYFNRSMCMFDVPWAEYYPVMFWSYEKLGLFLDLLVLFSTGYIWNILLCDKRKISW